MSKSSYPAFAEFKTFFAEKKLRTYKKGQIILYGGDSPSGMFYIESGHVKAYSLSEKGEEKIHMFFKKNEIFPLIWPFKRNGCSTFYQAMGEVAVRMSDEESFHTLLHSDFEAMHAIVHKMIDVIDVFVDRVENLQFTRSYNRVVARILMLARRFGTHKGKKITIELPITHLDIANTIALTRETVSRDIEVLIKKRIISQKNHLITINSIERLKKELSRV